MAECGLRQVPLHADARVRLRHSFVTSRFAQVMSSIVQSSSAVVLYRKSEHGVGAA